MQNVKTTDQYLITTMRGRIFSFLLQNGKAVQIHCDEPSDGSLLGSIYIGKIKNIAKNIGAAFVEIAPGQVCYLPLTDIKNPVYTRKGTSSLPQAGDELLVQVSREGIKTKFPSVTTNLTLHGKYMLLTTGNRQHSVSSKLSRQEREDLLTWLASMETTNSCQDTDAASSAEGCCTDDTMVSSGLEKNSSQIHPCGWLLRTNAGSADRELLLQDYFRLKEQYEHLMQQAQYRTCFSCLFSTPPAWLRRLSDLYDSEADCIMTDDRELYKEITSYLSSCQKEDLGKLRFYENDLLPMCKMYSLEHQLEQALSERIWLNSGGYLVIQPTEALTVIDVNTGKYEGGKKKEAAFLKINLEAAAEAARQIRLRNLSGIIIIDFINMESEESVDTLLSVMREYLRQDPIQTTLVDMTKLSLVEITRKKVSKTLLECCTTVK